MFVGTVKIFNRTSALATTNVLANSEILYVTAIKEENTLYLALYLMLIDH